MSTPANFETNGAEVQADTPETVDRSAALGFAKACFAVGVLWGGVLGAGLMVAFG